MPSELKWEPSYKSIKAMASHGPDNAVAHRYSVDYNSVTHDWAAVIDCNLLINGVSLPDAMAACEKYDNEGKKDDDT